MKNKTEEKENFKFIKSDIQPLSSNEKLFNSL